MQDVKDYGATGNGTSDDTSAIQDAIDAAAGLGDSVWFPSGTYRITSTLTGGNGLIMLGVGKQWVTIKGSGITLIESKDPATRYFRWALQGFTLDGTNKATSGGVGLNLTNISLATEIDIAINNVETAFTAYEAAYYNAVRLLISNVDTVGIIGSAGDGTSTNECEWYVRAGTFTEGITIDKASHQVFVKPAMEDFTGAAFHIAPNYTTQNIDIISPRLENVGGVGTGVHNHANAQGTSWIGGYTTGLEHNYVDEAPLGNFNYDRPLKANPIKIFERVMFADSNLVSRAFVRTVSDGSGNPVIEVRNADDTAYADVWARRVDVPVGVGGKVQAPVWQMLTTAITLATSGHVTLDASVADPVVILHANATSSSISNTIGAGQRLTITWVQDGTGGHSYVWPTNCKFAGAAAPVNTTPNRRTSVTFAYDGGSWFELSRAVAVG